MRRPGRPIGIGVAVACPVLVVPGVLALSATWISRRPAGKNLSAGAGAGLHTARGGSGSTRISLQPQPHLIGNEPWQNGVHMMKGGAS